MINESDDSTNSFTYSSHFLPKVIHISQIMFTHLAPLFWWRSIASGTILLVEQKSKLLRLATFLLHSKDPSELAIDYKIVP